MIVASSACRLMRSPERAMISKASSIAPVEGAGSSPKALAMTHLKAFAPAAIRGFELVEIVLGKQAIEAENDAGLPGDRFDGGKVSPPQREPAAFCGEGAGDRLAHALRRTGDGADLAGESEVHRGSAHHAGDALGEQEKEVAQDDLRHGRAARQVLGGDDDVDCALEPFIDHVAETDVRAFGMVHLVAHGGI